MGLVLVGTVRGKHRVRRLIGWTWLAFTAVLLLLWLLSIPFAFGYVGSWGLVSFESGGFAVYSTGGSIPATGWTGIQRSRWATIWWIDVPAMIPLMAAWVPAFAAAVPTALLWTKRKPRPGHCKKCGYDLTGNVSGICPECGTELDEP